ncbi:acyl carrier protein [Actinokineospora sp. G85]|uniref:acyl carrier protein n=1 Tax=Actinokineospora sp. G85 TaxID=3406626 RepID=UPI003C78285B
MSAPTFTLDDLKRVLLEGSGVSEGVDLTSNILDVEFDTLGYDSLALLETASRIEREYGIEFDEALLSEATTPRAFLDALGAPEIALPVN